MQKIDVENRSFDFCYQHSDKVLRSQDETLENATVINHSIKMFFSSKAFASSFAQNQILKENANIINHAFKRFYSSKAFAVPFAEMQTCKENRQCLMVDYELEK